MSMMHIETVVVPEDTSSLSITGIPQIYNDLLVLISLRSHSTDSDISFLLNGNTSNRTHRELVGTATVVTSSTNGFFPVDNPNTNATANTFGSAQIYISNYSATDKGKTLSFEVVTASTVNQLAAGLWDDTAAVTSFNISQDTLAGSTVSVYGITAGSDGTTTVS